MCPQKKTSSGLWSGERGGQATHFTPATRPSCLGDMPRRQVQNDVRGDDLFVLDAFRLCSFLPLRVECDPMFH
ncbi:hypothetical protein AVEN_95029-1, partial [Araneus ventricosus]